jgi:hypothetical protein
MGLGDRPTTDLLILLIGGTICAGILLGIVGVVVVEVVNPQSTDLAKLAGNLNDVISTLVGLLAGWLAGRTEKARVRRKDDE